MLDREIEGLKKEVREGGRVGVSKLAPGSRPIQARYDDQGKLVLYWAAIASGVCTMSWAWPGQGSPPSTEAIKEAQPQMADVRPTRNECPRALLCLVYCVGRAQSCFLTILRIPLALLTPLAPASCTLHPEFYTP